MRISMRLLIPLGRPAVYLFSRVRRPFRPSCRRRVRHGRSIGWRDGHWIRGTGRGAWATPRNLAELARRAERLGYRSLWTFQRLLAPSGAKLAPVYKSVLDPMVSLGYLAAATSSIRLGVAVDR